MIRYTYDAADRLTGVDYGMGRFISYAYDANGNLSQRTTAIASNADVQVTKTSDVTGRTVGIDINYTVTVTNAGPDTATGVVLIDDFPFGMVLKSAALSQGSSVFSNRTFTCDIGILPVGASATLTITAAHAIVAEDGFTNAVTVTAHQADPDPANNAAARVTSGLGPINDSDGDGMPNWWETLNGLGGGSLNNADADRDGDGIRNFDEWVADTDPLDPESRLEIHDQIFEAGAGEFSLTIQSSPIRQYDLEFTEDLSQPFAAVETVNGTGGPITFSHTSGTARGYYRVQVRIPEL